VKKLTITAVLLTLALFGNAYAQVAPVSSKAYAYFKTDSDVYPIQYDLAGGTLDANLVDLPARSLMFMISSVAGGQITVELPRKIIDSTRNGHDRPYFVSLGSLDSGLQRIDVAETETTNDIRVLRIDFPKGKIQIQIAGTFFVENQSAKTIENPYGEFSPLKQWMLGIDSIDVKCKKGLQLIIRPGDHPACVSAQTKIKLIERGLAINDLSTI
jgi:hypothetical protein